MPKVTSADGTIIAYDKKGQGPTLILVLGALNKRGSGKKLAGLLAGHFTVISYDRRGRGDSTEELPYSSDKEVGDIKALIDENDGSAYLYGHSSGAILALLATKELGEKVKGLALYELPYNDDPQALENAVEYRNTLSQLLTDSKLGDAVSLFVKSVGVTDKQIDAMKHLPMWKGLTSMAHTLNYDTVDLMEQYSQIDTDHIQTKILVMYGGASPEFMAVTARKLFKTLPSAKLRALEDQTHDVKAEVLAPALIDFLNSDQ